MTLPTPGTCSTSSPEPGRPLARRRGRRGRAFATALVAAALMVGGGASAAVAAEPAPMPDHAGTTVQVDASAASTVRVELGRGMVGTVDTERGTVLVESPGGLVPAWDSALLGIDRYELGEAWTWGTPFVKVVGGLRVFLPGLGRFEADASQPNGLSGYPGDDLSFFAQGGRLPARGDVPEREYAFQIQYDAGETSYFDDRGDLIATIEPDGAREDRVYQHVENEAEARVEVRLERVVDAEGAVTTVDNSRSPLVLITSAATGVQTTFSTSPYTAFIGSTTFSGEGFAWSDFTKLPSGEYSRIGSIDDQLRGTTANLTWDAERPGRVTEITRDGTRLYPGAEH